MALDPNDPNLFRMTLDSVMREMGAQVGERRFVPARSAEETFQVRGCGDPTCARCNPELAERVRRGEIPPSVVDSVRNAARNMRMGMGGPPSATLSIPSAPAKPKNDEFEEARERVEKWLTVMVGDEQSFDDIVGNAEALGQLRDAIRAPIEHAELYAAYGMKMPKGALLSGPPGCGKTMFARAAAAEMARLYGADAPEEVEFICLSGSELQQPFVGVTEGFIKDIFAYARAYKEEQGHPLLVFIDEADVLFPDRTGRVRRVAPWEESQVATFLAEMDGLQESGAFVLLASNRPEVIDQALLRDGRCDFKIKVARPDRDAVEVILQRAFRGALVAPEAGGEEALVFAALEGLFSYERVIFDFHAIVSTMEEWFKAKGLTVDSPHLQKLKRRAFLLEHIVSGAMAVSIPGRAKRYAFARDKRDGVPRGIAVEDVFAAVNDVFEENRGLDHSYALMEFQQGVVAEVEAELKQHREHGK